MVSVGDQQVVIAECVCSLIHDFLGHDLVVAAVLADINVFLGIKDQICTAVRASHNHFHHHSFHWNNCIVTVSSEKALPSAFRRSYLQCALQKEGRWNYLFFPAACDKVLLGYMDIVDREVDR